MKPTAETYRELQEAYDWFNRRLFGGELPGCLITFKARARRTYGYFAGEAWANREGVRSDEIALNPVHLETRPVEDTLATLVKEMLHLWQHRFGKPGRGRYQNREFAARAKAVGLIPSGGKETGDRVTHSIAEDGAFAKACTALLAKGFTITWREQPASEPAREGQGSRGGQGRQGRRETFSCEGCGLRAWAKFDAALICGACHEPMLGASAEPEPEGGHPPDPARLPVLAGDRLPSERHDDARKAEQSLLV